MKVRCSYIKKWIVRKPDETAAAVISRDCGISLLAAEILTARGVKTPQDAVEFAGKKTLEDPFCLADMDKAVEVILDAVNNEQNICIYGDYDCDGVTATAMLYTYLQCLGADARCYIPEREEGYGMSCEVIKKLADDGVELIITVDNGISAIDEAKLIAELGMRLVVTDHHQPSLTLPRADAIVNPHRRDCTSAFKPLCGAGVVLKLIAALEDGDYDAAMEQFGDLAAIGTVADIVSLTGENRCIVENGLRLLENTERVGLRCLLESCGLAGKPLTATNIGFMLTPKINAAGRFASPMLALKLIISEDEDSAAELAETLLSLNNDRRECELEVAAEIQSQIENDPSLLDQPVLFFSGKGWHNGVIGILCARLVERFGKPCFIASENEDGARGSARSFEGFSIFECLSHCSELLQNFGGHLGAGGFSLEIEKIPMLKEKIIEYALSLESMPVYTITADKLLRRGDFFVDNVKGLSVLEPFGCGNSAPVFVMLGARIESVIPVSNGKHTKLKLSYDGTTIYAMLFGHSSDSLSLKPGDSADLLVTLEENIWNEKRSVSVKIRDFRLSGIDQRKYFSAKSCFEAFRRGKLPEKKVRERMLPARSELVSVYKLLGDSHQSLDDIFARASSTDTELNFCRFLVCIDAFAELGIASVDRYHSTAAALPVKQKVRLEESNVLRALSS